MMPRPSANFADFTRHGLVAAALVCGLTQQTRADNEDVLTVDESIQLAAIESLGAYKPATPIARTAHVQEIDNKGNFGKLIYIDQNVTYSLLENGLWAIASSSTSPSGSGSSLRLSLCGLITLVHTAAGTSSTETASVIPVGKLFVPFGIRTTRNSNLRIRLKGFETTAKSICAPAAATEFSYRMETERRIKMSGFLSITREVSHVFDVRCNVGAEPRPASAVFPKLRGEALPVTCESTAGNGEKMKSEYVFLRDSGIYVQLTEIAEYQTTRLVLKDVEYAP